MVWGHSDDVTRQKRLESGVARFYGVERGANRVNDIKK